MPGVGGMAEEDARERCTGGIAIYDGFLMSVGSGFTESSGTGPGVTDP